MGKSTTENRPNAKYVSRRKPPKRKEARNRPSPTQQNKNASENRRKPMLRKTERSRKNGISSPTRKRSMLLLRTHLNPPVLNLKKMWKK